MQKALFYVHQLIESFPVIYNMSRNMKKNLDSNIVDTYLHAVRIQKSDQTGDWTQAFWTYTRCSNHWAIQPCWVQSFMYLPPQIMVTSHPQRTIQSTIDQPGQPNDDSATTTWARLNSSDRLHNPSSTHASRVFSTFLPYRPIFLYYQGDLILELVQYK